MVLLGLPHRVAAQKVPEIAALAPSGDRRMGANPHANGGRLLRHIGEKAFGGGYDGVQRTEEMVVRYVGPQPAPDLFLQVELRRVAG